jgi:hypothetical protein
MIFGVVGFPATRGTADAAVFAVAVLVAMLTLRSDAVVVLCAWQPLSAAVSVSVAAAVPPHLSTHRLAGIWPPAAEAAYLRFVGFPGASVSSKLRRPRHFSRDSPHRVPPMGRSDVRWC